MLWVIQYGVPLEQQTYQFEPADYLFMLIFNGCLCMATFPIFGEKELRILTFCVLVWGGMLACNREERACLLVRGSCRVSCLVPAFVHIRRTSALVSIV